MVTTTGTIARRCETRPVRSACCGAPLRDATTTGGVFPWRGRGWPAGIREERHFVTDLEALTGDVVLPFNRSDVTALMNALRSGITLTSLLAAAPGLKPERLLAAHRELEWSRQDATRSWEAVLEQRDAEGVLEHGVAASLLMPALMTQLELLAIERPALVPAAIDRCEQRMELATDLADAFEARIANCRPGCSEAMRIGTRLFDADRPSAWSDVFYLPRRVADLVPERVAGLLKERSVER